MGFSHSSRDYPSARYNSPPPELTYTSCTPPISPMSSHCGQDNIPPPSPCETIDTVRPTMAHLVEPSAVDHYEPAALQPAPTYNLQVPSSPSPAPSRGGGLFRKLSVKLGESFYDMVFLSGSAPTESMTMARSYSIRRSQRSRRSQRRPPPYSARVRSVSDSDDLERLVPESKERLSFPEPLLSPPLPGPHIPSIRYDDVRPSTSSSQSSESSSESHSKVYMRSWRLSFAMAGIFLALSLTSMESTIVGTSVVPITVDLGAFDMVAWIFSGYLMTFASFLVLSARLSDVIGRKLVLMTSLTIFITFSLACGLAQSMTQLIVFRAFQGIGGSGIYSLSIVVIPDLVVPKKRDMYAAINAVTNITMALLGLVVGGLISTHTTWRWIFLLMVPFGALAWLLIFVSLPNEFPDLGTTEKPAQITIGLPGLFARARQSRFFQQFDCIGAVLLLVATAPLLFAIQEGGSPRFPWSSPAIIACLILAAILYPTLVWYEIRASNAFAAQNQMQTLSKLLNRPAARTAVVPLLPKTLYTTRVPAFILLFAFLSGMPFYTLVLTLPQRFEIVNLESPIGAAVRLLPLLIVLPLTAMLLALLAKKIRLPALIALAASSVVLCAGLAALSTATVDFGVTQYAMEALAGVGTGPSLSLAVTLLMTVLEKKDPESLSTGLGAFLQARTLGGTISSAICGNILNTKVKAFVAGCAECTAAEAAIIEFTPTLLTTFDPALVARSQELFADIFATDLKVAAGIAGLAAVVLAGAWEPSWVYL